MMQQESFCLVAMALLALSYPAQCFTFHHRASRPPRLLPGSPTTRQQHKSWTSLAVVADAEEMEKQRFRRDDGSDDRGNDDEESGDAWIPTESGGFLPNLRRNKLFKRGKASTGSNSNNVIEIEGLEDYKREVVCEKEQMVCVRFYAPWCRACKAVAPAFKKMTKQHSDSVKFVEVPVTNANVYLHQGLGIPSLPYAHLYHPDVGLVEERKIGRSNFPAFRKALSQYVMGFCELESDDEDDHNN